MKLKMKKYVFDDCDGNNGDIKIFDTAEEAIASAKSEWEHLTNMDKARYRKGNGCFEVYEIEISESDLQECLEGYGLPINEFLTRNIKNWFENN